MATAPFDDPATEPLRPATSRARAEADLSRAYSEWHVTPGGFVAVGSATNPGGCGADLPCTAVVFTSTDGRSWQRQDVKVPDGVGTPDTLTDAVAVGGRIISVSVELDGLEQAPSPSPSAEPATDITGARFWRSEDGLTWTPIEGLPPDLSPSPYQPLAARPDRVVMVGDLNSRIAVSPDS